MIGRENLDLASSNILLVDDPFDSAVMIGMEMAPSLNNERVKIIDPSSFVSLQDIGTEADC